MLGSRWGYSCQREMPRWKRSHGGWLPPLPLLLQGTPSSSGLSLTLGRQGGALETESWAEVRNGNFFQHSSLFAFGYWPHLGAPRTGLDLCPHFQQLVLLRDRGLRQIVKRVVKQRLQLGKARLHRLRWLGAVTARAVGCLCRGRFPIREGFCVIFDLSRRISRRSTSLVIHPHWGEVATCQVSQDVCLGGQQGVTGPEINVMRGEQQEEVEGSGDEGQGQTDCPGAAAKAPNHPAERIGQRDRKRLDKCESCD